MEDPYHAPYRGHRTTTTDSPIGGPLVLEPMVLSTGSSGYREDVVRQVYGQFELGFGATTVTMLEFLPLNGFESALPRLELPDGLILQPMSGGHMDHAINALAVPRIAASSVNRAQRATPRSTATASPTAYCGGGPGCRPNR